MNMLTTKHRARALEAKGRPLGWVGVMIVIGFVGIVFATALVSVQATIPDNIMIYLIHYLIYLIHYLIYQIQLFLLYDYDYYPLYINIIKIKG